MNNSVPNPVDESIQIVLTRLEFEHKLAMRGLVGVLTAAVVGLIIVGVIVVLAMLLPIYVEKGAIQLTGGEFVAIVVALLISIGGNVFLYGAFVYRRLAMVEADFKNRTGKAAVH
jgi:hypothetical protein